MKNNPPSYKRIAAGLALCVLSVNAAWAAGSTRIDYQAELIAAPSVTEQGYFQPPGWDAMPSGEFGAAVKRGYNIFRNTQDNAADYVGNGLSCANCHLNSGRRANSAPLWGAWGIYPKYRKKNDKVNTMEDRIQGCFTYSLNGNQSKAGHAPGYGSDVLRDLQAYMFWLATGAPTGKNLPGRGYMKLAKPELAYDPARGKNVFAKNCAICHGVNGQGTKANGKYAFPPLWGPDAYNWGAGMHRVNTAAGFIKANMPLGKPNSLTDQEAWDVAAYINSEERPQDPRHEGDIDATAKRFHNHQGYYGKKVDGVLKGQGLSH